MNTRNKPISDYAKWLVKEGLSLNEANKTTDKCDFIDSFGKKYLVRSKQNTGDTASTTFSVIRNKLMGNFDYLATVTFVGDFSVTEAYLLPAHLLAEYLIFNHHQNGYT